MTSAASPGSWPAAAAGCRASRALAATLIATLVFAAAPVPAADAKPEARTDVELETQLDPDGGLRGFPSRRPPVVGWFELPVLPRSPPPPGLNVPDAGARITMIRDEASDMDLATVTPKLGRYFGTEKGVLVVRAPPGGAMKLEDGDVILSIDGREPTSGPHATSMLRSYQPGEKVRLRIMRHKKAVDIETTLPEPQIDTRVERRILRTLPEPADADTCGNMRKCSAPTSTTNSPRN